MSKKGNIQYISDTLLLEKVLRIEEGITKQAGLVDSFQTAAKAIKDQVAARVESDGLGVTLVNYIVPAVLFKIWWPLGILESVASLFGVNIGQIMNGMMNSLKSKIESGESLTMDEINDAGKAAAGGGGSLVFEADDGVIVNANDDFFFYLREIESNGKLTTFIREAQLGKAYNASPFFGGKGQKGVLGKIFGSLFTRSRPKGKWLIIGIVIWFVKTVLLGAGLVEGSSAVKNIIKPDDQEKAQEKSINPVDEKETQHADFFIPAINIPNAIPHNFKPSGQGQQYHINDGQSIWIVPLLNNDTADTLISWALSIYPEVQGREDELRKTQPFNNMVSILNNGINPKTPKYLTVPKGLTSRKAVVDKFIGSISQKDNKQNDLQTI